LTLGCPFKKYDLKKTWACGNYKGTSCYNCKKFVAKNLEDDGSEEEGTFLDSFATIQ